MLYKRSLALVVAFVVGWVVPGFAQEMTFRLPDDDPNTNSAVIRSISLSPDGSLLAVGYGRFVGMLQESRPGQAVLWDVRTGLRKASLAARIDGVCSVAFSPDGARLASAEYPGTIRLWDVHTGGERLEIKAPAWIAGAITFSPDGRTLAAGLWTGAIDGDHLPGNDILLWDAASGNPILTLKGHSNGIRALGFSPDGKSLISGSMDGTAKIWNVADGTLRATLESPSLRKKFGPNSVISVDSVLFAPDGQTVVVTAGSKAENIGEVTLWTVPARSAKATLKGSEGFVEQVAFSPDGKFLATAGSDQLVRLWSVSSLQEVDKVGGASPIAFSLDGKEFVRRTSERLIIQKLGDVFPQLIQRRD